MWLILAAVTPVGIPISIGLAWTFAPAWIPRDALIGATLLSPLFWLPITVTSSIVLGRSITEANDPRMRDTTATWIAILGIFGAHCVFSLIALYFAFNFIGR